MDWTRAWKALAEMDALPAIAEAKRLDALWREIYQLAFVRYALVHVGWTEADAETWAADIVEEALVKYGRAIAPQNAARADVVACEQEEQNG